LKNKHDNKGLHVMSQRTIKSPLGRLSAFASNGHLIALAFPTNLTSIHCRLVQQGLVLAENDQNKANERVLDQVEEQLGLYFGSTLTKFSVPVRAHGTEFQQKIWRALGRIPWGNTTTYGELARKLGCPGSARAIGAANAKNPIAIIIPCHRVTGAGNKIKGFAGGSAAVRGLLAIERKQPTGKGGSKDSHDH
jgi:O-6-methylguanine DNA methyltransferase